MKLAAFVEKANVLLWEALKDFSMGCYNKAVSAFWFSIEQLLRAIIYFYKRSVYERSGKLIGVFSSLPYGRNKEIIVSLNTLYNLRRIADHTPRIIDKKKLYHVTQLVCVIVEYLTQILEKIGISTEDLKETISKLPKD